MMNNTKAALSWIIQLLNKFDIPYQIAGGLAACFYGSKRELADIDIDIPQSGFNKIIDSLKAYITYGPSHYRDDHWDLYVMTLCYQGQEIDLTSTDNLKIFNPFTEKWELLTTDLSKAKLVKLMDLEVFVIPKNDLLSYKKILRRPVDILDVQYIENNKFSKQEHSIEFFETSHMIAKRITEEDFNDLLCMHQNEQAMAAIGGVRSAEESRKNLEWDLKQWEDNRFGLWMFRSKENGELIGRGGLRRVIIEDIQEIELGYAIMPEYWRQGLATEMAMASLKIGFEILHMKDMVSLTLATNKISERVLQKVGFKYERDIILDGQLYVFYRLTLEDYMSIL